MTRSEMNSSNMYFFSPNGTVVYTEQDWDKGVFLRATDLVNYQKSHDNKCCSKNFD